MVDGTNADVTSKLQQYPDVKAVWINFSVASIGAAQAIGAMPEADQPLLVTFYANPATVADINAGRVDAAVDESLEWQSWAGVDALMQLEARGQQPSQERAPTYNGVNFSVRQIIDADERPARRHAGRVAHRLHGVLPGQVVHGVHQPAQLRSGSLELVALGVVIRADERHRPVTET